MKVLMAFVIVHSVGFFSNLLNFSCLVLKAFFMLFEQM